LGSRDACRVRQSAAGAAGQESTPSNFAIPVGITAGLKRARLHGLQPIRDLAQAVEPREIWPKRSSSARKLACWPQQTRNRVGAEPIQTELAPGSPSGPLSAPAKELSRKVRPQGFPFYIFSDRPFVCRGGRLISSPQSKADDVRNCLPDGEGTTSEHFPRSLPHCSSHFSADPVRSRSFQHYHRAFHPALRAGDSDPP
jgi:hypothetical protein